MPPYRIVEIFNHTQEEKFESYGFYCTGQVYEELDKAKQDLNKKKSMDENSTKYGIYDTENDTVIIY